MTNPVKAALVLGGLIAIGLVGLAITAGRSALAVKGMERSVTVKGLAEREVPADLAVWPIRFAEAGNDLSQVYAALERNSARIVQFLTEQGFPMEEVSVAAPTVNDKLAQQYGNNGGVGLRYAASQAVTVRTSNIDLVRATIKRIAELGKTGIVFSGSEYQGQFSVENLDSSTPHVKKVRVVSTVEYYLSD
jgi:uncharacterized protein